MKKSASFHQQRAIESARRRAAKRRAADHEYAPTGYDLTADLLSAPAPLPSANCGRYTFHTPNLAQTIIAPHVNRKHGTDNRE